MRFDGDARFHKLHYHGIELKAKKAPKVAGAAGVKAAPYKRKEVRKALFENL